MIRRFSVAILPWIMHLTTAIRFFHLRMAYAFMACMLTFSQLYQVFFIQTVSKIDIVLSLRPCINPNKAGLSESNFFWRGYQFDSPPAS